MAVHRLTNTTGFYFVTFTCYRWLQLIELTHSYRSIYQWFDLLKQMNISLCGYVIMPNHIHLLLYYQQSERSLNTIIGNGKRFLAYAIVKKLDAAGQHRTLSRLQEAVRKKDQERGKKHHIWQRSFDIKECRTEKFILQKLHYIHNNPCADRWKLALKPWHYRDSSAYFYNFGKPGYYPVTDYLEIMANDTFLNEEKNSSGYFNDSYN